MQPASSEEDGSEACHSPGEARGTSSSLGSSMRTTAGALLRHSSSDGTPRAESRVSRGNSASRGYRRGVSGNRRTSGHVGLPLQRDLDLSSSGYSQRERRAPPLRVNSEAESGAVVLLGEETAGGEERAATCCQLCGSAFSTIRLPLLLFCGHSYCEACIHRATDKNPPALKCGMCSIVTPLGQQSADCLPRNESIMDLVTSREFKAMVTERNVDKCAECRPRSTAVSAPPHTAPTAPRRPTRDLEFAPNTNQSPSTSNLDHSRPVASTQARAVCYTVRQRDCPCVSSASSTTNTASTSKIFTVRTYLTECILLCVVCTGLSKVASKYAASVTERLSKLDRMERDLNTTALSLAVSVDEVNNNARKVQERLERHCNGT